MEPVFAVSYDKPVGYCYHTDSSGTTFYNGAKLTWASTATSIPTWNPSQYISQVGELTETIRRLREALDDLISKSKCSEDKCPIAIRAEVERQEMLAELEDGELRKEAINFFSEAISEMLCSGSATIGHIPARFLEALPTMFLADAILEFVVRYNRLLAEIQQYRKALNMYKMFVSMARMTHANSYHAGKFEDCQETPCAEAASYSKIVDQALQGAKSGPA